MEGLIVDEALFIEKSFRANFSSDEKLVIYGLGKNTKTILERCSEYSIVGLMDRTRTGEEEWGLPIIGIDEVYKKGVKKVVILATSSNVPIIYRRIEKKCSELMIEVYDINGNKLEPFSNEYKLDSFYDNCRVDLVKEKIENVDVVSFDIFDTLLMRKVLFPTDIFDIVANSIAELIPTSVDFSTIRVNCERKLYAYGNPTIYDVYQEIKKELNVSEDILEKILLVEIEEEKKNLVAREVMKDIISYARSKGKTICCTSDMYFNSEILSEFLYDAGYDEFDAIFVSCEYGKSKSNGLFKAVKEQYDNLRILHVGDNYDADIISAKRYGVEDSFMIPSAYRMAGDSLIRGILAYDDSLDNRCELGRLLAYVFNNPFLLYDTRGKIVVKNNYDLGYYFIEPMIASFIDWMIDECTDKKIDRLLLGSRDGFIIRELLDIKQKYSRDELKYQYFYASRFACTLAGLNSEDDVRYAFKMAFDGTKEELLKKRFELSDTQLLEKLVNETDEEYLERHIPMILEKSKVCRIRYQKQSLISEKEKTIGFFDFVSSGTCQLWLEEIYQGHDWIGLYFLRNLDSYKEKLNILSYYEPKYVYEKQSKLYKNYIFMENIMTSYEPTLHNFGENGEKIFEQDFRDDNQIVRLKQVHDGILAAYEKRLSSHYNMVASRNLVDDILDLLNGQFSVMKADFFNDNVLMDSFCNRDFDLKKMVNES